MGLVLPDAICLMVRSNFAKKKIVYVHIVQVINKSRICLMFITILKITKFLITKEEITETSRGQYCFIVCADLKGWGGGRGLTQVISCKFKSRGPPSAHASFTMYFYWSTASFFIVIYTWPPGWASFRTCMQIKHRPWRSRIDFFMFTTFIFLLINCCWNSISGHE